MTGKQTPATQQPPKKQTLHLQSTSENTFLSPQQHLSEDDGARPSTPFPFGERRQRRSPQVPRPGDVFFVPTFFFAFFFFSGTKVGVFGIPSPPPQPPPAEKKTLGRGSRSGGPHFGLPQALAFLSHTHLGGRGGS